MKIILQGKTTRKSSSKSEPSFTGSFHIDPRYTMYNVQCTYYLWIWMIFLVFSVFGILHQVPLLLPFQLAGLERVAGGWVSKSPQANMRMWGSVHQVQSLKSLSRLKKSKHRAAPNLLFQLDTRTSATRRSGRNAAPATSGSSSMRRSTPAGSSWG